LHVFARLLEDRLERGLNLVSLNDYTFFSANEFIKYGVVEVVHDFCLEHDFEWVFFALEGRLYSDVVLRKII